MKIKILFTVRDVFDYLSDKENFSRIFIRAEENFYKKHPIVEEIWERCPIEEFRTEESHFDYLDMIIWDNLSDEDLLQFFIENPDDDLSNYHALEFKKFAIQSLKEDLNNFISDASRFFNILPAKA